MLRELLHGSGICTAVFLILALVLSAWMAFRQRGAAGLPGCGTGSGCHAAANSRWSKFFGLPVTVLGACIYLLTLIDWISAASISSFHPQIMRVALVTLAWIVVGAGVWFTLLQVLVIRRVCSFCELIHVLAVGAAAAILYNLGPHQMAGPVLASFGMLLLVGGQVLIKPTTYLLQSTREMGSTQEEECVPAIDSRVEAPASDEPVQILKDPKNDGRQISVLSGHVTLSLADWPILGDASAENVLVFLFDYTCAGCRHLHRLLDQARERYGKRLAVVDVPVPLSPSCNPGIKPRQASDPYACAYARLGLGVWIAKPDQYESYVRWILASGEEPPTLGLARQEAARLTGSDIFDPSAPDPDIDPRLHAGLAMYQKLEVPNIPALLFPHGVLNGHVSDVEELLQILNEPLGMR
jgi:uncharacterized membrane protein